MDPIDPDPDPNPDPEHCFQLTKTMYVQIVSVIFITIFFIYFLFPPGCEAPWAINLDGSLQINFSFINPLISLTPSRQFCCYQDLRRPYLFQIPLKSADSSTCG